jgi:hypothetical protein
MEIQKKWKDFIPFIINPEKLIILNNWFAMANQTKPKPNQIHPTPEDKQIMNDILTTNE